MPYVKVKVRRSPSRYRIRKSIFWGTLLALTSFILIFTNRSLKEHEPIEHIRVGICGAVNKEAVFTLQKNSDLSMLVRLANGLAPGADYAAINLNQIIENDSIYHIPWLNKEELSVKQPLARQITDSLILKLTENQKFEKDPKMYSILFIGQPAVFVLINYSPELKLINFIQIPHNTLFLNNDYRLIDIFYTFDIQHTMQIVSSKLNIPIQYHMIQDRFEFMRVIELLGGIEIIVDNEFAQEYKLKAGKQRLDAFKTWEFIRFMDWKNQLRNRSKDQTINLIRDDAFTIEASKLEYMYVLRSRRQRMVLQAMRDAFGKLPVDKQLKMIGTSDKLFNSNMDVAFLRKLYSDLLETPEFAFGSLPGYYSRESEMLFFLPDKPGFKMLLNQEIRRNTEQKSSKKQLIY
jgi:hypothetical protein